MSCDGEPGGSRSPVTTGRSPSSVFADGADAVFTDGADAVFADGADAVFADGADAVFADGADAVPPIPIPMKRPLPAGWRWVRLGEVCKQDRAIVEPDSTLAEELPYLSLEHIESNTGRILKSPAEKMEDEGKSATFYFDNRHVLYGKLRPYLNKVALPDFAGRCTTEMIPLLPNRDIDREFLCWVLRRQETVDAAMRGKTGSRMPRADIDELFNIEIPLPPLAEQERIAAILCEQMAAAEQARRAAEEQLEAAKSLPAAYLRAVFNCPVAQQWPKRRLGEFLLEVRNGIYKPNSYYGRGTPMIRMFNIGRFDGKWDLREVDSVVVTPEELRCFELREGDVVVNRVNSRELVGKCAVVDRSTAGLVFESKNMRVRLKGELVLPDYFSAWLNCEAGREQILARLKQIVGQATINRSDLENLELPVPPLPVQRQVVAELAAQMAAAERARQAIEEQLEAINKLPAAVLRKAFNGEF